MKYVLIIIDGAADLPLTELGEKTPLEVANTSAFDELARGGVLGRLKTCPDNLPCGSDVAIMSVLGYDPALYYSGRAPIEAAAQGIKLPPQAQVFRTNLVTIKNEIMIDHSADNITQKEADQIINLLNEKLANADIHFYSGVSYRNLMVSLKELVAETIPPHDILDKAIEPYLPKGRDAEKLNIIFKQARQLIKESFGNSTATDIWLWGQGKMTVLPSFKERFGLTGAVITGVDLVKGLANLIGWDFIKVPGVTAYFDTNYQGMGEYACAALNNYDLVCVHIEAPDEAGHKGDWQEKIKALENIDKLIVRPILEYLRANFREWRICLLPDHPTPCKVRTHTHEPVLFAYFSSNSKEFNENKFCEKYAASSKIFLNQGPKLMNEFIQAIDPFSKTLDS